MRLTLLFLLFIINFSFSSVSYAKRFALVIGNSDYKIGALKNPANDAKDMSSLLKKKGFQVQKLTNANKQQMEQAINTFTKRLHQKNAVGLFYFAGHGVEVNGQNYLIPVGKAIENETEVEYDGVNAGRVMSGMRRAGNNLNMVILDACRNNPFAKSFRSGSRGLARVESRGSMVLYATSPGEVAADGDGKNGLFTQHLMESMNTPNLSIDEVFNLTANKVSNHTGGQQLPWKSGVIINGDKFHFTIAAPNAKVVTIVQQSEQPNRAEIAFWESIRNENDPVFFKRYLEEYPEGIYADLAHLKVLRTSYKPETFNPPNVNFGEWNITTAKKAYRVGKFDKATLKKILRELQINYDSTVRQLKMDYRNKQLSKAEYKMSVRRAKATYAGR